MNRETILYRIVHPAQAQGDVITSQVFRPNLTGSRLLSVYDGDQMSPENAWESFASRLSADHGRFGVIGVTVAECQTLGLRVGRDDSLATGHAFINFVGFSPNQIRRKTRGLKEFAMARGWLIHPEI